MKKEIYLLGVGKYTEVIIELAIDCGYKIKGLYHYDSGRKGEVVCGFPIIDSVEKLFTQDISNVNFAVAIGNNKKRLQLSNEIRKKGGFTPSLIHPRSKISPSSIIGSGCFFHCESMVWTKAEIGDCCVLSPYSQVSHHAKVDDACFVTTYSIVGAYCVIGKRVMFGLNSVTIPNIKIGNDCVIGSKSNVLKDFGDDKIIIGNPAIEK